MDGDTVVLAGRRRDESGAEIRRFAQLPLGAQDEVQEAPIREDLAAADVGGAEPVAFDPPAMYAIRCARRCGWKWESSPPGAQ